MLNVMLGAWGLGAIAGTRSKARRDVFEESYAAKSYKDGLSVPPISSHYVGCVEIFPFLLFDRVYIDERSYHCLLSKSIRGFELSKRGREILREFEKQGVLVPLDYAQILSSEDLDRISIGAEDDLRANNLPSLLKRSRSRWMNFLRSSGGKFHPNRNEELQNTSMEIAFVEMNPPKEKVKRHAILDIYDVNTMVVASKKLGVAVCDWQMYGPFYDHKMMTSVPWIKSILPENPDSIHDNLDIYVPIPSSTDFDTLNRIREDPAIELFGTYAQFLSQSIGQFTPKQLIDLKRQLLAIVADEVSRVGVYPYLLPGPPVFTENLSKEPIHMAVRSALQETLQQPIERIAKTLKELAEAMEKFTKNPAGIKVTVKTGKKSPVQIAIKSDQIQGEVNTGKKSEIVASKIIRLIENVKTIIEQNIVEQKARDGAIRALEEAMSEMQKKGSERNLQRVREYLKRVREIAGSVVVIREVINMILAQFS